MNELAEWMPICGANAADTYMNPSLSPDFQLVPVSYVPPISLPQPRQNVNIL